jgi:hypothetical protein
VSEETRAVITVISLAIGLVWGLKWLQDKWDER